MKTIKRIMAALICMTIALTGIPISVKAADSSGSMSTEMETNSELFITLEENKDYRWNVNDNAEKNSVVHLDSSEGNNCRFRLDHIENEWYGIKHIKVDGTDRFADVDGKSKDSGAVLHLWESSDSEVKGNNHRQFAFYYIGNDANGNARYYIKNRNSGKWIGYEGKLNNNISYCYIYEIFVNRVNPVNHKSCSKRNQAENCKHFPISMEIRSKAI